MSVGGAATNSARSALRQVSQRYLRTVARLIAFALPPRLWYRALFRVCGLQQRLLRPLLALPPYRNDPRRRVVQNWLMDSSIEHLISLARPFPIPIGHKGLEVILEARENPSGLVLCSVHLPLVRLALSVLVDQGVPPTAVVVHEDVKAVGALPVWGTAESLPALAADRDVLLKVRTVLRRGGFVAALIDSAIDYPPISNMFRLIRSVGARVAFVVSEIQPDGTVMIEFLSPPDPFCTSDESVVSNIVYLQESIDRVLHLPARQPMVAAPPQAKVASQSQAMNLKLDSSA